MAPAESRDLGRKPIAGVAAMRSAKSSAECVAIRA